MKCLQCSRNAFIRELFHVTVSRPKTGNADVNIRFCFLFTVLLLTLPHTASSSNQDIQMVLSTFNRVLFWFYFFHTKVPMLCVTRKVPMAKTIPGDARRIEADTRTREGVGR